MEDQDKLRALIAAGPDPTKGLQHLVLSRFMDITRARRSGLRNWKEIAAALDMPGREKALSAAYARVKKRVGEKALEAPAPAPAAASARPKAAGVVDPVSGFRTPATPQKKEGADDHKWIE